MLSALAVIAIGGAAAFLLNSERQTTERVAALRAFDLHAREATDALADLRTAQQAYVAAGQGVEFWMPKVATIADTVTSSIGELRRSAASAEARSDLDQAMSTVTEFADVDTRVRGYLKSGQALMAGDVIFTEGTQTAASGAREVEAARLAELQGFDATEAQIRKQEALALGVAAGVAVLVVLMLVPAARVASGAASPLGAADAGAARPAVPERAASQAPATPPVASLMRAAADLATDVGRARDFDDLARLLSRVGDLMDAQGLIVWVGSARGDDLRPILAHGYSPQLVSRMPAVPRTGDNAAAAAYRTGTLRIVLAKPGLSNGAIVAPILTANGCVGAVSAEIRGGGEASETTQALAALFAAQLANVIGVEEVQGVQEVRQVQKVQDVQRVRRMNSQ